MSRLYTESVPSVSLGFENLVNRLQVCNWGLQAEECSEF